jgi:hypothetical protein
LRRRSLEVPAGDLDQFVDAAGLGAGGDVVDLSDAGIRSTQLVDRVGDIVDRDGVDR